MAYIEDKTDAKTTDNSITNPINHIYWLWLAWVLLAGLGIKAYLSLRDTTDCILEKVGMQNIELKVQLTRVETQLSTLNVSLEQLHADAKDEMKERIRQQPVRHNYTDRRAE